MLITTIIPIKSIKRECEDKNKMIDNAESNKKTKATILNVMLKAAKTLRMI